MAWSSPPGYGVLVEGMNSHQEPPAAPSGDLESLLLSAKGLVEQVADQLYGQGMDTVPRQDMLACGQQGLLEAALRFDANRGASFRTFAYYRVRGAMLDGARKMGSWSRRGFERVTLIRAANCASEDLAEELSDVASLAAREAAERIRKHMAAMVTAMTTAGVFAEGVRQMENDGLDVARMVAVDHSQNAEEQFAEREIRDLVRHAIDELPPPEDEIVRRFYVDGHNMDSIAHDLGRSRSWVSRVHTRALTRMGARLRHNSLSL